MTGGVFALSNSGEKIARAGAGIRVSKERLQPLGVVGAFFGTALLVFAVIPLWVMYSAEELAGAVLIHRKVVLLVHLYALGLGGFVALGALRQLAPVVFQSAAPGDSRTFRVGFVGMFVGFLLFVYGISGYRYAYVAVGGAFMTLSFAINFTALASAVRQQSRRSVIQWFVLPAALSLIGTGALGMLAAWHRVTGILGGGWAEVLGSHLYLGPLGFYGFLVPGVTYELAPFFGLTRGGDDKGLGKYERVVLTLMLVGFALGWGSTLLGRHHPAFMIPVALGLLLFVFDLRGVFRRRDDIRKTPTLTGVRASQGYLLAIAMMIGVGGAAPQLWGNAGWIRAFAWLIAAGWLSNAVIGYLHRILPFLAWHTRYWGKPKEDVRTRFQDMVGKRLGKNGLYIYNAGVIGVTIGFGAPAAVLAAGAVMAVGAWVLVFNLGRAFFR